MELVSSKPKQLNSITNKISLPYIVDTLERYSDLENQLEAIIQREYTAIHSSVYWKFRNEAQKYTDTSNKDYIFKEIVLKRSTRYTVRSTSKALRAPKLDCKEDLKNQLNVLSEI
jgi:hypothetical protein